MIRHLATLVLMAFAALSFAGDPVAPGTKAPDFTLTDASGAQVALASFAGKTVVLEWVNYDCPFVKKHYGSGNMPALQAEAKSKGVVWLSICSSAKGKQGRFEGTDLTSRIASEKAVPTHYLIDGDGVVGKAYGATTTPQMVVIDAKGVVAYHGAIDSIKSTNQDDVAKAVPHLKQALAAVLAGTPVPVAQTKSYGCGVKY